MRIIPADEIDRRFDFPALVAALRDAFRGDWEVPTRHHHTIPMGHEPDATLLLMPAWSSGECIGVKVVSIFPGNAERGEAAVRGTYYLADGTSGAPLALLDGARLTLWRTAAASALAAGYLARPDSTRLLMVGTGKLAPFLVRAHCSVRPVTEVAVWGRNPHKAQALADALDLPDTKARAAGDLREEVEAADMISCATLSTEPLVRGEWLREGTHLDLVGAFTPDMRESDNEAVRRAHLFVDTRAGALKEGGDVLQPLRDGVIAEEDVLADLFDLCRGYHPGRTDPGWVTLFKSTGTAIEDLAAARLAYARSGA